MSKKVLKLSAPEGARRKFCGIIISVCARTEAEPESPMGAAKSPPRSGTK